MTGSQTDAVSIPQYLIVSVALQELAGSFFERFSAESNDADFLTWLRLRRMADEIVTRHAVSIRPEEGVALLAILATAPPSPAADFLLHQKFEVGPVR